MLCGPSKLEIGDGQEASWEASHLAAGAGFAPARPFGLRDNPNSTARRKVTLLMGIEPTFPGLNPGVLPQLNYRNIRVSAWSPIEMSDAVLPEGNVSRASEEKMGKWRDRTE